jgi:hypothetical protein
VKTNLTDEFVLMADYLAARKELCQTGPSGRFGKLFLAVLGMFELERMMDTTSSKLDLVQLMIRSDFCPGLPDSGASERN